MKKILSIVLALISFNSYASWNRVPDQTIYINIKYDQETQQFYDISASGSDLIEIFLVDGNQIKIKHGRDGYKGVVVPVFQNYRVARDTFPESKIQILKGNSKNESFSVDVGRGGSKIIGIVTTNYQGHFDGGGCRMSDTWKGHFESFEIFSTKTNSIYSSDWCLASTSLSSQYSPFVFPSDGGQIGFIERYFRFPIDKIKNLPLDVYVGTYLSHPTADVIRNGNSDLGRELYKYVISFDIKPSINSFTVDNESLAFSVNRQNDRILGKAQTGFNIRGSFHNSQSFELTFKSLNNSSCSGSLCMFNTSAGTALPYTVKVLDPSTLQEKTVSRSGQKVTIDADQNYQVSSGLFFEFDSNNTALSGTFNDVVTVRAELKLM